MMHCRLIFGYNGAPSATLDGSIGSRCKLLVLITIGKKSFSHKTVLAHQGLALPSSDTLSQIVFKELPFNEHLHINVCRTENDCHLRSVTTMPIAKSVKNRTQPNHIFCKRKARCRCCFLRLAVSFIICEYQSKDFLPFCQEKDGTREKSFLSPCQETTEELHPLFGRAGTSLSPNPKARAQS